MSQEVRQALLRFFSRFLSRFLGQRSILFGSFVFVLTIFNCNTLYISSVMTKKAGANNKHDLYFVQSYLERKSMLE